MKNKCPKCGYEYNDFDVFCARCGNKLENDEILQNEEIVKEEIIEDKIQKEPIQRTKFEFFNSNAPRVYNGMLYNFITYLVITCLLLIGITYYTVEKQATKRAQLQFKNLMNNPQQIPRLTEPQNFDELSEQFNQTEKFLELYLKYSTDDKEKKEQVFNSFLKEINKLPHLTNENLLTGENECSSIVTVNKAKSCSIKFNKELKNVGIIAYPNRNTIYLYPDYKFIKKTYSKYFSKEIKQYLSLKARYNKPTNVGLDLYIQPKKLANKIYDFEKMYNSNQNTYLKEDLENTLYNDLRSFIFNPSIYATTTQEMTPEFKKAYKYYISTKRTSALVPLFMSYLDKQKGYQEDNFKMDYPYNHHSQNFEETVQNATFNDIFAQLRDNILSQRNSLDFSYIYNIQTNSWRRFDNKYQIQQYEYVVSNPDENNNILIYDNNYTLLQELNIYKYSSLYLINNALYSFNKDKLTISKISFNGRTFSQHILSNSDVTSIFPGVEVINIDSYQNYDILIEKDNQKAGYIILSRYAQGFESYELSSINGSIQNSTLPNMFYVNSAQDCIISFHSRNKNPEETSETTPTYKITIHTKGYFAPEKEIAAPNYVQYDEQTAKEEQKQDEDFKPNIMPKIEKNLKPNTVEKEGDLLTPAPKQKLEPPEGDNEEN